MIVPIALVFVQLSLSSEVGRSLETPPHDQASPRAADASSMTGIVRDASGGVVAGASVTLRSPSGGEQQTLTGPDGRFTVHVVTTGEILLIVRASGLADTRQSIPAGAGRQNIEIVLTPAKLNETVTVTATRSEQRMGDVPASVSVLSREEIRRSPAVVADDVLRQIPTFSLFRRTSSLAANPTTQGVSLRGVGPSGVSRTLVLLDGIPFNDPFGGWVYWTRVPLDSAERIEVVDGSGSSLYGNYAMGGVINIVTSPPARRTVEMKAQYGNLNSPKFDFSGSDVWGKLGVVVDGSTFSTKGYPPVVAINPAGVAERGLVDNNANVDFRNVNVRLAYDPTDRVRAFVRGGYFDENRDNGKISTTDSDHPKEANDTTWKTFSGGVRIRMPDRSDLQASAFTDVVKFHSNALAVSGTPARSIGRMTLKQTVPTKGFGGMVQWSRAFGSNQLLTAGTDGRQVDGDSQEETLDTVTGTQVTQKRISGGTQRSLGVFVQDVITPLPKLTMTLSARLDHWRNYDAHNLETSFPSGTPTANNNPALPDKKDRVVSPRVAARYHLTDRVSVWGDIGGGFRAPTLNELYRSFRVGAVTTNANNQLGPERLVGGEAGLSIAPKRNLVWRTTWFDNRVKNPVSNVSQNVGGTILQRQNLGRTRISGVQSDVDYRIGAFWKVSAGYLYDRAKVVESATNPALGLPSLVGKYLPQVPKHRGSVQVAFSSPRYLNVAVGIQAIGTQFDDDQNVRLVPGITGPGLPKYAVVAVTASRAIGRRLEAFVGAQNLLDQQYFVGTLPTTIGSPRLVNGGIRVRLTGR